MKNAATAMAASLENPLAGVTGARAGALAVGILVFSCLTAIGARVSVPIPGSPVPATLQTLAVLMAGLFLGAIPGSTSQLLYVAAGLSGLPVFALPGASPLYLLGPTGGYLAGFVIAPWIVGRVAGTRHRSALPRRLLALLLGSAAIHLCGFLWLLVYARGDGAWAIASGMAPFVLLDLAKIVIAAAAHSGWVAAFDWSSRRWRSSSNASR